MLTAGGDEAILMSPLDASSFEGVPLAILAGSPASSRRSRKVAPDGPPLIDLTGALEDVEGARLRAPSAEPALPATPSGLQVIAHPGAIAIAMFLAAVSRTSAIRRSIIHVFEPASERGQRGVEELQQQTVAVLSFQKVKTDVFDGQLAFNMLAAYGEEALEQLDSIEGRLERHLATLLAAWPGVPMPSLRVIQAPVFHGHSFSIWTEFEEQTSVDTIKESLNRAGIDVRDEDPPANAQSAGMDGLSVGAIAKDRNNARAVWFWLVGDNLRLAGANALSVAKEML